MDVDVPVQSASATPREEWCVTSKKNLSIGVYSIDEFLMKVGLHTIHYTYKAMEYIVIINI
jgi:hypothetical protein